MGHRIARTIYNFGRIGYRRDERGGIGVTVGVFGAGIIHMTGTRNIDGLFFETTSGCLSFLAVNVVVERGG